MKCLHEAEELRESELKQRVEDSAALGDCQAILSYENLIEHEQSRSQWRKTNFFLKQGIAELLTCLLYQDFDDSHKITTDGEEIQTKIIDQNKNIFRPPRTHH